MKNNIIKKLKKIEPLNDKTIFIIGGTGEIGYSIIKELVYLNVNIILGYKNKLKVDKVLEEFSNIKVVEIDLLDLNSINKCINKIKDFNIDYFILNSGYYNDNLEFNNYNMEYHFMINCYSIYYFIKNTNVVFNKPQYIVTSSISYKQVKTNTSDIFNSNCKNINHLYAHSKRVLMQSLYSLNKNNEYNIVFTHPGIVYTKLFERRNNKGFKALFMKMFKLFMLSCDQAALNMIYCINKNIGMMKWIGPKGLFEIFGSPGIKKLKKNLFNCNEINYVEKEIERINKEVEIL